MLEPPEELFLNDLYKYQIYSILHDMIIYSQCFNLFKYFDSTSFIAIDVLIKNLESLSSLSS